MFSGLACKMALSLLLLLFMSASLCFCWSSAHTAVGAERSSVTFMRGEQFRAGRRALLRDISPPGMWTGDDDEDESFHAQRRALLADLRDISPPGMWIGDDDDDESFHAQRRALLADLRDISPPGMWTGDDDDDESFHAQRRSLLVDLRDISPPGMWSGDDDDVSFHAQRRALLADLCDTSPLGLFSGDDDDNEHVHERRALLTNVEESDPGTTVTEPVEDCRHPAEVHVDTIRRSRALLRDISPPGLWTGNGDDDDDSFHAQRRALVSNLRDISPPRLFSGDDDNDDKIHRRRALLTNEECDRLWSTATGDDDEKVQFLSRALLSRSGDLQDRISSRSPAIRAIGNSDEDQTVHSHQRRVATARRLLSIAGSDADLFHDISPPGLWPPQDSPPSRTSFRFLLSNGENMSALESLAEHVSRDVHYLKSQLLKHFFWKSAAPTSDHAEFQQTEGEVSLPSDDENSSSKTAMTRRNKDLDPSERSRAVVSKPFISPSRLELPLALQPRHLALPDILSDDGGFMSLHA